VEREAKKEVERGGERGGRGERESWIVDVDREGRVEREGGGEREAERQKMVEKRKGERGGERGKRMQTQFDRNEKDGFLKVIELLS
jgi:hypothetical protein